MVAWEDLPFRERFKLSIRVMAVYGARELLITLPYAVSGIAVAIAGGYALVQGVPNLVVLGVTAVVVGPTWYWLERSGKRVNFDNRVRTWFDQVVYRGN